MEINGKSEVATVVYPTKVIDGVLHFYLACKKQNIHTKDGRSLKGTKKLNGYGGKLEEHHESIFACAVDELREECGIIAHENDLVERASVEFFWPGNTSNVCDMKVVFFVLSEYKGTPSETHEMGPPELYSLRNVPWDQMNMSDESLLPHIFANVHYVTEKIYFKEIDGKTVIASRFTRMKRLPLL